MSQISYQSPTISRQPRASTRRETLQQIDEALWAAYRKYDRSAVMEKLLQRYLRVQGITDGSLVTPDGGDRTSRRRLSRR